MNVRAYLALAGFGVLFAGVLGPMDYADELDRDADRKIEVVRHQLSLRDAFPAPRCREVYRHREYSGWIAKKADQGEWIPKCLYSNPKTVS